MSSLHESGLLVLLIEPFVIPVLGLQKWTSRNVTITWSHVPYNLAIDKYHRMQYTRRPVFIWLQFVWHWLLTDSIGIRMIKGGLGQYPHYWRQCIHLEARSADLSILHEVQNLHVSVIRMGSHSPFVLCTVASDSISGWSCSASGAPLPQASLSLLHWYGWSWQSKVEGWLSHFLTGCGIRLSLSSDLPLMLVRATTDAGTVRKVTTLTVSWPIFSAHDNWINSVSTLFVPPARPVPTPMDKSCNMCVMYFCTCSGAAV